MAAYPPPARRQATVAVHGSDLERDESHVEAHVAVARVQRHLASLEGTESALVVSSGTAATVCALLALLRAGDHLLASQWLPSGTRRFLADQMAALGVRITLVDPTETRGWRKRVRKETRAIFVDSPATLNARIPDLRPIAYLTKEVGLALVVDSTAATPVNFRPLEHGADVVVHSAFRLLHGDDEVEGGVVLGTAPYVEEARRHMDAWGQAPSPHACAQLERGLATLDVRVRRANANALELARWCAQRDEFSHVLYPGLETHPDHALARDTFDGFGATLALVFTGGAAAADRAVRRLRLIGHRSGLGGVRTLASPVRSEPDRAAVVLPDDDNTALPPDGMLLVSVGIEDVRDLIGDLAQSLAP